MRKDLRGSNVALLITNTQHLKTIIKKQRHTFCTLHYRNELITNKNCFIHSIKTMN